MKTRIFCSALFVLIGYITSATDPPAVRATVNVAASASLQGLASKWVAYYQAVDPDVTYRMVGKSETPDLVFISDAEVTPAVAKGWKMVIGRDVIVPLVAASNPRLRNLETQGVSPSQFAGLCSGGAAPTWSGLPGGGAATLRILVPGDPAFTNQLAQFLQGNPVNRFTGVFESPDELLSALQRDPDAIGFCRLSDALAADKQSLRAGIRMVPVDKNGNGMLDPYEDIYSSPGSFLRGVWLGKFPASLTCNLYAAAPVQPVEPHQVRFLEWILAAGQDPLYGAGFFGLNNSERAAKSAILSRSLNPSDGAGIQAKTYAPWILPGAAMFTLLLVLLVTAIQRHRKRHTGAGTGSPRPFAPLGFKIPGGVWFDRSHTWVFREKDGAVRVGIDDFLAHLTGSLTRVTLRQTGETIRKGGPLVTLIRNGKQLTIPAPVSGTILACNGILTVSARKVNQDPFEEGWLYRIEPENWSRESQFLLLPDRYNEWLKQEMVRLKEFFTGTRSLHPGGPIPVVLQDGGELSDHPLADLGPEIWEEFQIKIIDGIRS